MANELSVILAGKDQETGRLMEELRKLKSMPIRVEMTGLGTLRETLTKIKPHLLVYHLNGNRESVQKSATAIGQEFHDIPWAIASQEADVESILHFFRLGAVDFLKQPLEQEEVRRLFQKVIDLERNRESISRDEQHRMIGIFSTKGGVGLTTLATNLAVGLAKKNAGRIMLLDLVLQHGNVSDLLDVSSQYTMMDVIENFDRMDATLLDNSLARHKSGLYVLPCPKRPEDADFITAKQAADMFQTFKETFHYMIADLGHEYSKTALSFMDVADTILLVTTPDVPSLSNTKNALSIFKRLGYGPEKVKVVLNRWHMKGEIDAAVIQKSLALELFWRLPDDVVNCLSSSNQGKCVDEVSKNSEFAKAMDRLNTLILTPVEKGK